MIKQLRVDERLIHGQIATAWSRQLNVGGIVVANDEIVNNPLTVKVLKMSVPAGKKVLIQSMEKAEAVLKDPRIETMDVLVIVNNPKDALTLARNLKIKEVNIGNYVNPNGSISLTNTVIVDDEDITVLKEISQLTESHTFHQVIPTTPLIELSELMKDY